MPKELNIINAPGSGNGDVCTYLRACAICDETERCQKDKEGHSRWLVPSGWSASNTKSSS